MKKMDNYDKIQTNVRGVMLVIFVSGIHGVGKTYFCNLVREKINIQSYSASQLIATKRNKIFSADKLVSDIYDNQTLLVEAIKELREREEFILDGHFCLLNELGKITRIPSDTYTLLKPDVMILLTEQPEIIADRRFQRDGVYQETSDISAFQEEEKKYAEEIAEKVGIPLVVSHGADDLNRIVEFIRGGLY